MNARAHVRRQSNVSSTLRKKKITKITAEIPDVCEVSTATIKYRTFYFWNRLVVVRWWFLMFGG